MSPRESVAADVLPTPEESEARLAAVQQKIASRLTDQTLADWWQVRVDRTPDRRALRTDARDLTFQEVDRLASRVASWAREAGLGAGDTVAIQLPAGPAFLALILGLAKVGAQLSLLGTGLRGRSLGHALREIPPRLVVTTAEGRDEILKLDDPVDRLDVAIHVLASREEAVGEERPGGAADDLDALEILIANAASAGSRATSIRIGRVEGVGPIGRVGLDAAAADTARAPVGPDDTLFYIFTSGTTGLPKATRCSHRRYLAGATTIGVLQGIDETDCMYVVLPMFHISALSSIGAAFSVSASVVIRPRFSASRFWLDVRRFGATSFQYLGEILRYLIARPPSDADRPNTLRVMIGAGVDEKIWRAFEARFGPVRIIEAYGASEGVIGIYNLDGVVGSVGRPPRSVAEGLALVRVDAARGELLRGADGRLTRCEPGEAGELIARLAGREQFEGYSSEAATQAKFVEDAFAAGDLWYRSGDLFRVRDGYYYFVARLGETYRWKSENVSTQQVAEAIGVCDGIDHAVVYGVAVPGHEGRAGMALVNPASGRAFDGRALYGHLKGELPGFAIPLFVRLGDGRGVLTDTYKLGVGELKSQGYAPGAISDPLFVLDAAAGCYVPLTDSALERLGLPPFAGAEAESTVPPKRER